MSGHESGDTAAKVIVEHAALASYCADLFRMVGVPADEASQIASNLVEADLRGVESHGVVRLPIYLDRLAAGANKPRPTVTIVHETPTSAVVDGDNGMGQIVGEKAMEIAIAKGKAGLCAFVSVRNSNHFGAAAFYAQQALAHDMIGLSLTIGGINHMTPWGGAEAMLGNNPFAVAMPAGEELPVVLDMACSVAARGKIIVAAKSGTPIPGDWATGPDGAPTTDPVEALEGFVLPVGGPKGYALTLVIGLLSTMLSGAAFGSEVTHMYDDLERPQNIGHLMGVIPIGLFEDAAHYKRRMDKAIREIRSVRKAPGVERVSMPGEREYLLAAERRRSGVPVDRAVWRELVEAGGRFGVSEPMPIGN